MSSDYGDFCRAQRTEQQRRKHERGTENTRVLKKIAQTTKDVSVSWRDHNSVARIGVPHAVIDYWPSTGTARVVSAHRHGEQRRHQSAVRAVAWARSIGDGRTTP